MKSELLKIYIFKNYLHFLCQIFYVRILLSIIQNSLIPGQSWKWQVDLKYN